MGLKTGLNRECHGQPGQLRPEVAAAGAGRHRRAACCSSSSSIACSCGACRNDLADPAGAGHRHHRRRLRPGARHGLRQPGYAAHGRAVPAAVRHRHRPQPEPQYRRRDQAHGLHGCCSSRCCIAAGSIVGALVDQPAHRADAVLRHGHRRRLRLVQPVQRPAGAISGARSASWRC